MNELRRLRRKNNVTGQELADLLEVNLRTYWRMESGQRKIRQCEIEKVTHYIDELNAIRAKRSEMVYSNRGRQ